MTTGPMVYDMVYIDIQVAWTFSILHVSANNEHESINIYYMHARLLLYRFGLIYSLHEVSEVPLYALWNVHAVVELEETYIIRSVHRRLELHIGTKTRMHASMCNVQICVCNVKCIEGNRYISRHAGRAAHAPYPRPLHAHACMRLFGVPYTFNNVFWADNIAGSSRSTWRNLEKLDGDKRTLSATAFSRRKATAHWSCSFSQASSNVDWVISLSVTSVCPNACTLM